MLESKSETERLEEKRLKEHRNFGDHVLKVYNLLTELGVKSGREGLERDYMEYVGLRIGGHEISACIYYQWIEVDDEQLTGASEKFCTMLENELVKRLKTFDKKTKESIDEATKEALDKPISKKKVEYLLNELDRWNKEGKKLVGDCI